MREKNRRFSSSVPSKAAGSATPQCAVGRLTRPYGTLLGGGLVADGKDEIEVRAAGSSEFVPVLGTQVRRLVVELSEQLDGQWMYRALGVTARAKAFEFAFTPPIDRAFSHDAARRIPGAEKQDVVLAVRHDRISKPNG
jgi:hypothetical protein